MILTKETFFIYIIIIKRKVNSLTLQMVKDFNMPQIFAGVTARSRPLIAVRRKVNTSL